MEEKKASDGGDAGGGAETPGSQLSREEVMAQRAEKKKLKEARKNKTSTVAESVNTGAPDQKQQAPKTSKPQREKQSSETPKGKQGQQSTTTSDTAKSKKDQQQTLATDTPKPGEGTKQQQQQQKMQSSTSASAPIETTPLLKSATKPSETNSVISTTGKTTPDAITTTPATVNAPVLDDSKAGTPDRSIIGTKSVAEFQSTIQSLFKLKKTPELMKNLTFKLHPLFHNLGVKLRHDVIRGTNQRCVKLLDTIKEYVHCYETPSGVSFKHGLSADLQLNMDVLRKKCPFAIGMNNAVEFLSAFLYKMDQDVGDIHQQKDDIVEVIDQYIEEKIEKAVEAIVFYGTEKVRSGDVIMLYSITEAVLNLLERAAKGGEGEEGKSFELIIIQTPETMLDIPVLLQKLNEPIRTHSVTISSVNFSNAIYRMRHCTKILIGGHGLFTTGGVMAQSGSGKLALLAATFNKPAIFLCETYKFCDRSPLDFFTLDEYIPEQSVTEDDLFEPKIKYDVTPANLVTVVITDIDMLPSTCVPVVLRVQEGRAPRNTEESAEAY